LKYGRSPIHRLTSAFPKELLYGLQLNGEDEGVHFSMAAKQVLGDILGYKNPLHWLWRLYFLDLDVLIFPKLSLNLIARV
jgi:hypothetical protein